MKRQNVLVLGAFCCVVLAGGTWLMGANRGSSVLDAQAQSIGFKDAEEYAQVTSFSSRDGKARDFSNLDFEKAERLLREHNSIHRFRIILDLGFAKTLDQKKRAIELVRPYASDPEQRLAIFQVLERFKAGEGEGLVRSLVGDRDGGLAELANRALAGDAPMAGGGEKA
jgi:hypothetical protein